MKIVKNVYVLLLRVDHFGVSGFTSGGERKHDAKHDEKTTIAKFCSLRLGNAWFVWE